MPAAKTEKSTACDLVTIGFRDCGKVLARKGGILTAQADVCGVEAGEPVAGTRQRERDFERE